MVQTLEMQLKKNEMKKQYFIYLKIQQSNNKNKIEN